MALSGLLDLHISRKHIHINYLYRNNYPIKFAYTLALMRQKLRCLNIHSATDSFIFRGCIPEAFVDPGRMIPNQGCATLHDRVHKTDHVLTKE